MCKCFYIAALFFLMLSFGYNIFMFAFTFVIWMQLNITRLCLRLQRRSNQSDVI